MPDPIPNLPLVPARRTFLERASIVWAIPILALIIAMGIAWQSYVDRGPLIAIKFENGEGVKAQQTELRFRDVTVGLVERVAFSDDLSHVQVFVRLDKDVAPYVDGGARFWVVRPQVSAQGISGLDTVLSGVFIEGSWDSQAGGVIYEFNGLPEEPLIKPGEQGLQIALRSTGDASLESNIPILFRGVEVGRLGQARISRNGDFSIAEAIIFEPHDRLVSDSTRFWDTSGFTFSIGASGAELDFSSVASLIGGGVSFGTVVSGGTRVPDGTVFEVYPSEAVARASVFNAGDVDTLEISALFTENVAGLTVGSPVELRGLVVGEVSNLSAISDRTQFGDARVRLRVTLAIQPARLGLEGEVTPEAALGLLAEQVAGGVRARLASAGLLSGGLKVELVSVSDSPPARLDMDGDPYPIIPVTDSNVADVGASAQGVLTRISDLPVEELMASAISFLTAATNLVSDPALNETPDALLGVLGDVRGLVGSESAQNIPVALNATLAQIERLLADLEEAQAVEQLVAAIDQAATAATRIGTAVEGVPALLAELETLSRQARALPLETLVSDASQLIATGRGILDTDAARALPGTLEAALAEVQATLAQLRQAGAVDRLVLAIDAASSAALDVGASVEGVPELIETLSAVASTAAEVPVAELSARINGLLSAAEALLDTPQTRALPGALADTLAEVQAALAELRDGGAVANLNRTLDASREAAEQVALSVRDLPGLIGRMTALLTQASETLQSYDGTSELNRSARTALRDIAEAAEAVSSLARAIERDPNSLLLGR